MDQETVARITWSAFLASGAFLIVATVALGSGLIRLPVPPVGGLTDGIAALRAGDYATAGRVFQGLADKNDAAGELWLAHLYEDGLGVAPDAAKAVALLTKAADAGSPAAAGVLGKLYLDGNGVLQDIGAARAWLSRAAHEGDAVAQRELGLLFYRGLGTEKDPQQAYVWLDIAVRNGDAQAREWRDRVLATLSPADAARAAATAADTLRTLTADANSALHADVKATARASVPDKSS